MLTERLKVLWKNNVYEAYKAKTKTVHLSSDFNSQIASMEYMDIRIYYNTGQQFFW